MVLPCFGVEKLPGAYLLVEFLPDADIDLLDHAGLMLDLAQLIGRKVDLVSKRALKPLIQSSILEDARLVYAA